MNWKQIVVLLAGLGVTMACLTALVIPHPEWKRFERTYQLGPCSWLSIAPMETPSFMLLVAVIPLTVAGAVVLSDRKPGRDATE